jgi:hypothetical protein
MGMYTGLKGAITFKPDVAGVLKEWNFDWGELAYYLRSDTIKTFSNKTRCHWIPKGALSYMPSDWDEVVNEWIDDTTYSFACSLKNYEQEIAAFIGILPEIADYWELEELYEESEQPTIHRESE